MYIDGWKTELRKGMLDITVLNMLKHSQHHGYEMVQTLKKSNELRTHEGSIYPVLERLKSAGLVISHLEFHNTEARPRKYFELTPQGHKVLEDMNAHLDRVYDIIQGFKKGTGK